MAKRNEKDLKDPREDEQRSDEDRGYDEAAHSGPSRLDQYEGAGGVFGTTGGGTYGEGFQTMKGSGRSPFDPPIRPWEPTYSGRALPYSEVTVHERGPHTGRGPKGYTRPDDRILQEVNDRLWLAGAIDASEIEVAISDGEITLSGTVPDRRMKRLTLDVAESVAGVREVFSQVRVSGSGEDSNSRQNR